MGLLGIGLGAVANTLLGDRREDRQKENQKELMDIQSRNQRELNKQGHELQMDMWNKTNYGAQMKHINEAGLNAGLLYGMGGAGGTTTGSQGGGSAQGGQAQQANTMDIANSVQIGLMEAQRDKIKAETKNIEQDTTKKWNEIDLMGYERARKEIENEMKGFERDAIKNNYEEWIKSKVAEYQGRVIENEMKRQGIEVDKEKVRQIQHKIWQDWVNAGSGVLASSAFITKAIQNLKK